LELPELIVSRCKSARSILAVVILALLPVVLV
jgi:hypothetical protein